MKQVARKVTREDLEELHYYWESKQDITMYVDYPNIKKDLKETYPFIWKTWKKYLKAKSTLNQILVFTLALFLFTSCLSYGKPSSKYWHRRYQNLIHQNTNRYDGCK